MSEVLRTVMQNAPYIGATAGFAASYVAERAITKSAADERQPLNEVLGDVAEQSQNSSLRDRMGRLIGPLAAAGVIAGGMVGLAFQQENNVETKTNLQMVVDRSGGTKVAERGKETPADSINKIMEEFASHDETSADVFVAKGGRVSKTSYQKVINQVRPIGGAPMQNAVEQAIDNVASARLDGDNTKNAVVVLTNDNSFGEPSSIINKSKRTDVSIYIKNVGESSEKSKTMDKIAKETGGKYLDGSSDPEELYEQVKDKSSGQELKQTPDSKHSTSEKIFSVLFAGGLLGVVARARRRMPLTYNGTKIEK